MWMFIVFILGIQVGVLLVRFIQYTERPYRWKCPHKDCNFRGSSDRDDVLAIIRKNHYETSH